MGVKITYQCADGKMRTPMQYHRWIEALIELESLEPGDLTPEERETLAEYRDEHLEGGD